MIPYSATIQQLYSNYNETTIGWQYLSEIPQNPSITGGLSWRIKQRYDTIIFASFSFIKMTLISTFPSQKAMLFFIYYLIQGRKQFQRFPLSLLCYVLGNFCIKDSMLELIQLPNMSTPVMVTKCVERLLDRSMYQVEPGLHLSQASVNLHSNKKLVLWVNVN